MTERYVTQPSLIGFQNLRHQQSFTLYVFVSSLCIFLSFFLYLCLYSLSLLHPSPRAFSARTSFGCVCVQASLSSKVALEADTISMLMEMQQRTYKRATVIHAQRKWTSTLGYAHSAAYYRPSRELKANHGERFGNHSWALNKHGILSSLRLRGLTRLWLVLWWERMFSLEGVVTYT